MYPGPVVAKASFRSTTSVITWAALAVAASALGAATLSGCEDEEAPQACPTMIPSGGNLVGTWEPIEVCATISFMDSFTPNCPESKTFLEGAHALGGTLEFRADGTYHDETIVTLSVRYEYPLRCLGTKSCVEVGPLLKQSLEKTTATQTTTAVAFCRGTDLCKCAAQTEISSHDTSTYTVTATSYTEGGQKVDYSAVGNELRVQGPGLTARLLRK